MPVTEAEVRSGAYYDSVLLMQLQRSLAALPGVLDAGVVMGTGANKDILAHSDLLTPAVQSAAADDLVIVVRAEDEAAASAALGRVDEFLTRRRTTVAQHEAYLPKSLESAAQVLPDARWVLISVPGRYAAGVARQALHLDKNVFLYSDNVSLDDETSLKRVAAEKGLLVMGPDCGTAIVNGVGLGFANRVRRGPVGLVAASGTGLQQVSVRIHQLGSGITHALGTGGRDLSQAVGAVTARQGLELLGRDPDTRVIALISKPPSPQVADELLNVARSAGKPVVVNFVGYLPPARHMDDVHFAASLDEAARLAVELATGTTADDQRPKTALSQPPGTEQLPYGATSNRQPVTLLRGNQQPHFAPGQRYLRGLFSGGSLAYEALLILQDYLPAVYSNIPLNKEHRLADSSASQAHTVVDLGEDEFTVGRLHPMMDPELRIRRLQQEADDPEVAIILLDVVLGYGAHPNPAGELAPAIARARARATEAGRHLEVIAAVIGTDEDPQDLKSQVQQFEAAGARVMTGNEAAVRWAGQLAQALNPSSPGSHTLQGGSRKEDPETRNLKSDKIQNLKSVDLAVLQQPLAAINVGLESFAESLRLQGAPVVHVDWRPPAGGDEKLAAILERMRR